MAACRNNQIDLLQDFLAAEPALAYRAAPSDITDKDRVYLYPLGVAAQEGHEKAVEPMLTALDRLPEGKRPGGGSIMAVINTADRSGRTPLHLAALGGHIKVVEQLLKAVDRLPETERPAAVQRLLSATDDGGQTPLQFARQQNHQAVAVLLRDALKKPAQTARLDSIITEAFEQPGSSKLPAAQPGASNKTSEVLAQPALPVDTMEPAAVYTAPPLSCLSQAAKEGNIECVKALLPFAGVLVNEKNNDGFAPLHYAAKSGHEACLRLLITSKNMKITLLHAAREGQTKVLEEILKNLNTLKEPAKSETIMLVLNVSDRDGRTLLCRAAQAGHEEVVALFLNALNGLSKEKKPEATKAVLSAADSFGRTPLYIAAHLGHYKIVTQLLAEDVETAFSYTCVASKGQEQVADLLKAFPILSAARNGQTTIVARMLKILETWPESERCQAVSMVMTLSKKDGETALHVAAQSGQQKVVEQFLSTANNYQESEQQIVAFEAMIGAVVTFKRTQLTAAVDNFHWVIVDQLIKAFPLLSAVLGGHNQSVKQLMQALTALPREQRGAAIMATLKKPRKEDGATPLYIAAREGNIEIMKLLLDAVTTLLADGKRKEAREVLYSACEVKEEDGTLMAITPLRIAAINRHDKAVNLLLEKIRELFIT
ncbi:ankyrin repeat domain-containing protein [Endozoicomonas sp. ALB091]|uniref:ankyrin repeat domain-containing protein n=1 Tax=Endozoicomonas sp. ALB091 TaxID=3403073 RepID=UPI003BB6C6F4